MAYDPFLGTNPVVSAMEQKRAFVEQIRENSGRPAQCHSRWTTTGTGVHVVPEVFPFNTTFIHMPFIQNGWALDETGDELDIDNIPRVQVGVYKWQQNDRGFFLGAYILFEVEAYEINYKINHTLTFNGIAIKDLPIELPDE